MNIQPVILTCPSAANQLAFSKMVSDYSSYVHYRQNWPWNNPVVVMDTTLHKTMSRMYLECLFELLPLRVEIHDNCIGEDVGYGEIPSNYESIQHAANVALWQGAWTARETGIPYVMFMEDDIALSSRIVDFLGGMEWPAGCGMLSLYRPGNGHPEIDNKGAVDVDSYYGTQAVVFPTEVLTALEQTEREWMLKWPAGYDIRWSRAIRALGYSVNQTEKSLVQHIGRDSRLHGDGRFHETGVFLP